MTPQEEILALRKIISEACTAIDNHSFMAETCSVEFMAELPKEIRLYVEHLRKRTHSDLQVFAAWGDTWFDCVQCGVRSFKAALVLPRGLGRPCCSTDCVQREREKRALGNVSAGSVGPRLR
jgi:hypothetical protein